MNEIILSSKEFKALSSPTRSEIIKLLQERNHTMSEIAKKLGLKAPTVKQHLDVLTTAELIKQIESQRKWKYYTLTRKGKLIFLKKETTNILVMLAVSIIALAGVFYSLITSTLLLSFNAMQGESIKALPQLDLPASAGAEAAAEAGAAVASITPTPLREILFYEIAAIVLVAMVVFLVYRFAKLRK